MTGESWHPAHSPGWNILLGSRCPCAHRKAVSWWVSVSAFWCAICLWQKPNNFPGCPAVELEKLHAVCSTHTVYHVLRSSPRFIQQGDVLWVPNVERDTGRIDGKNPFVVSFLFRHVASSGTISGRHRPEPPIILIGKKVSADINYTAYKNLTLQFIALFYRIIKLLI